MTCGNFVENQLKNTFPNKKECTFPHYPHANKQQDSFFKKDYHLLKKRNVDFVSFSFFTFVR